MRCLLFGLLAVTGTLAAPGTTLYVSPKGSDAGTGRADAPFATLERARDAVRKLKAAGLPAGGVTVELAPGTYELAQPFALTAEDSGTADSPITWRAKPGGEVRLTAGRIVRGWQPVKDERVLARLAPNARGKVVQADLKALGITDFGQLGGGFGQSGLPGLELFWNDQPTTLARYPNDGFIQITGVEGATPVDVRGTKGTKEGIFTYAGERPARWAEEKDAWVHGYWFWDWADQRHRIAAIDAANHRISVAPPYHGYGYRKGQWFYGFNLLCEIDQLGEWYLDRETGILYVYPPAPLDKSTAMVTVLPNVATLAKVQHVTLRGLTLDGARQHAVTMSDCSDCSVIGCTIRNVGSWALQANGGQRIRVAGCDVTATGDGGISLSGGDRKTLTPAGHIAENNHVHHWSRWNRMYRPAIMLTGCGLTAAHNLLDNSPHTAIGFSGNDITLEYNEIHSVCYESNDAGAIYSGRNWTFRGTVIRYNYLHHINGFQGKGCVGVYLDDQFSSAQIYGNLFWKVTRAAMIGGGRDCSIENNVFVDCVPATHVDARGLGWAAPGGPGMEQGLKAMPYTQPPWSTRFPQLLTLLADDPMAPKGNTIARNICVGGRWGDFEGKAKPLITFQDNLLDQDPQFADAAKGDFRLKADSPALKLGFKPLPYDQIGLVHNADRASWPVKSEVRPMVTPPAPIARHPRGNPAVVAVAAGTDPAAAKPVTIEQGVEGEKQAPASTAWLVSDGKILRVRIENAIRGDKPTAGATWGQDDAVELAFQRLAKDAPILVLRGFPNGKWSSSDEAGASAAAVKQAAVGVEYAAEQPKPGLWVATWSVPLASLGIDPAKDPEVWFNLSVRKVAGPAWLMWQGTGAHTWDVAYAGKLRLGGR